MLTDLLSDYPVPILREIFPANIKEGESSWSAAIYVPNWGIPHRCRVDTPVWCRELMIHLAPLAAQEETNALTNDVALQRAWFNLARGPWSKRIYWSELEAEIAQKDYAMAAAERMSAEGAKERQKLVAQLSQTEVEKFDCIHKLLPTVVGRLLQSH
nr:hypothetical protein [Tanacetum cinerariifolium]